MSIAKPIRFRLNRVGAHRGWLAAVARNLAIKRIRGDRRRALRETAASRPVAVKDGAVETTIE
jgi:DNA-directed RNA polymerase specialized sigma24 family protein